MPDLVGSLDALSELLERIVHDAPSFVCVFNSLLRPVFLNDYGRRMVGMPHEFDVTTLSIADFFEDADREKIAHDVLPALARKDVAEGEFRIRHFGGNRGVRVKWTAFPLLDATGEMIGAACFTTDLTARVEVESRLRESQARLKAAVDLVGLSSYTWDPQTDALDWDERLRTLWGVLPGMEVTGAVWMKGVHPDDRERVQAAADRAIDPAGDGVYAMEYRVIGLGGGPERWISTYGQTQFEDGRPVSFTGAVLDITDHKDAEAKLRQTEERFRRFGENSSDVIWIYDVIRQRLEYLSAAFQQCWGRDPQAVIEEPEVWEASIHPDDRAVRIKTLEQVIARGGSITHVYRIVRPDGSVRRIRDTTFAIRDAEGRLKQIGGMAHDTSSREPLSVYIVESGDEAREAKAEALRRSGQNVVTFENETTFLDVAASLTSGCVLVRIDDASPSPFDVARALRARRIHMPVIFEAQLDGDVELAIAAMKAGAADLLQAPADADAVLAAVASAQAEVRENEQEERVAENARKQIALMSSRERAVLHGLLVGGTNKTIGRDLGISPRTVELYRARVMERLGVHTLPEAVMAAAAAGLKPPQRGDVAVGAA